MMIDQYFCALNDVCQENILLDRDFHLFCFSFLKSSFSFVPFEYRFVVISI